MPRPKRAPKAQKAGRASIATSTAIRRSGRVAVQNIPDSDESSAESPLSVHSADSRRTLKAVVIPANRASSSHDPLPHPPATTKTSTSVTSGSSKEDSEDYDTPATSAANTPPVTHKRSSILGKRARSGLSKVNNVLESDAVLAAALQREEYGENSESANNHDDDHDDLSEQDQDDFKTSLRLDRNVKRSASDESSSDDSATDWFGSDSTSDSELSEPEFDSEDDRPLKKARAPLSQTKSKAPVKRTAHKKSIAKARHNTETTNDDSSELSELPEVISDPMDMISPAPIPLLDVPRRPKSRKSYAAAVREIEQRTGLQGFRALKERYRLEWAHPEIVTMWKELESIPRIPTEQAPQPEGINRSLKSFQLEGLNWMRKQELTKWRGGLLGDEMGMGKTIQAVSLIMSDYPQKDPTLVAVPPVALMQWTNEINEYTNGKLKVLVYHGQNAAAKKMTVKQLKEYDVIMISYAGLESIHRKETKGWSRGDSVVKANSPIHAISFHRLILDEAHSIKSRTTGVAKACFALKGTFKWCLSGTPVQNRIGEFFSLLRFLEVEPFANYFCKQCRCSCLSWSVGPDYRCTACGHRSLDHVSVFNQEILNPIIATDSDAHRKLAFKKLRMLTDRIMLRRMKRDYTSSMELPPKEVIIHREFFGPIESDFAGSIMNSTTRKFDTYVSRGVMLNNYANIFGLIMQMRQVADHPDLILRKNAAEGQNVLVCNICDEAAEDAIKSRCKHEFCRSCVKDFIKSFEGNDAAPGCPRCHIPLSIDLEQPEIEQDEEMVKKNSIINRIKMENWTSSTKIEMLVYDLWQLRSKKQTTKSIVFSQFTSMLQLVEWRLRRAGFNTVLLDGSMTPQQRQKSIEHFMTNPDVEVFLVSLKAGGVALNLTEASRVFIIDPWWNPAAEWQSADRCHRIGQRRPCVITRLVVEDSIESRIVMLQEKKAQMIQGTVNNDDVAMEKLTPQDMQFLFRGS